MELVLKTLLLPKHNLAFSLNFGCRPWASATVRLAYITVSVGMLFFISSLDFLDYLVDYQFGNRAGNRCGLPFGNRLGIGLAIAPSITKTVTGL